MSLPGVEERRRAAQALHQIRAGGASMKAVLPEALAGLGDARDRALCEAIVIEGCRWMRRYELILGRLLQTPLGTKQAPIEAVLICGLAQLDALQLSAHAAISATAEVPRTLRKPAFVGLVNAVLRRYQRERGALHDELATQPGFRHAHPDWMIECLQAAWPGHAAALLDANNRPGPLWLRVNLAHGSRDRYQQRLADAGLGATAHPQLPAALCLQQRVAPTALPGWAEGDVSVQDGAAQALVELLQLRPGLRVLDACAAPGGKTAAMLERESDLDVLALDLAPSRLRRMGETLQRLGLRAELKPGDATDPRGWWDRRPFDRIVIDAPCSATGVIRRQPDIKWHRRPQDLPVLTATQAALLRGLWPLLAPGGRLLYATCSVLPEENAEQVARFAAEQADALAVALPDWMGHEAGPGRQRLTGEDAMDGFFYAAFDKRG